MRFDWRGLPDRLVRSWRGSLQLRTVAFTVVLSALAVTAVGGYMSSSVRSNLFEQRRDQVIAESGRVTAVVQELFENADDTTEDLEAAQLTAFDTIRRIISAEPQVAMIRAPGQQGARPFSDRQTRGFEQDALVTDALEESVAGAGPDEVSWQSVPIAREDGRSDPGIIVGSALVVEGQVYGLYLVYNLREQQETLNFVQTALLLGGIALVLLIGAAAYLVSRLVVGPVRIAAATSEKLAAGMLEERLPTQGEDELATLARSFNRMADSIQRQIGQLADLSQVQQRFVSDVSHELRTPLTTIRLAGDVLYDQRENFPPATARTAELLHAQIERFEALLADLLEMSRYDAGAVQLELEPTNLVPLVEDAIEALAPLAQEKSTEIRLVAPGGYFEADVDARRVRRILQNLLGNAIDHGEARSIDVHVDSDARAVAIAVRDHGIGMTPEELEHVFDRFWRADPSRQRSTGGTGLGLAISQEDAAVHGGRLDVWSEPGRGSCFRLTLPRQAGALIVGSPIPLPPDEDGTS